MVWFVLAFTVVLTIAFGVWFIIWISVMAHLHTRIAAIEAYLKLLGDTYDF
jgi:hypothetical protein